MIAAIVYKPLKGMTQDVNAELLHRFQNALPDDETVFCRTLQELMEKGIRADCILGGLPDLERSPDEITLAQYCDWAGSVKWFQTIFTGLDAFVNNPVFQDNRLRLVNSRGISAIPISDHIMAFILCFSRCILQMVSQKQAHIWSRPKGADDLTDKVLGIIGMGAIGKETARKAKAFGMKVYGFKRTPVPVPEADRMFHTREGLLEMISLSDYVIMLLPASEETRGFMSDELFRSMKETAYFINTGRGICVDTDALIRALMAKKIKGAALDALDPEPLPEDSPLWDMENVLLTPHYAGDSVQTFDRCLDLFIENIARCKEGLSLKNEVLLH